MLGPALHATVYNEGVFPPRPVIFPAVPSLRAPPPPPPNGPLAISGGHGGTTTAAIILFCRTFRVAFYGGGGDLSILMCRSHAHRCIVPFKFEVLKGQWKCKFLQSIQF